jgi:primase-polymerase (primpol)-like protein
MLGWKEPKEWKDLEVRMAFSAQSDSTGHVMLSVELTGQDYDSHLHVILQYEAGQLEEMAGEIAQLLG